MSRYSGQVIGQLCWGIHWQRLTNLSMEFGIPHLEIVHEPYQSFARTRAVRQLATRRLVSIRGNWRLLVNLAYWRILRKGRCLASSGSSAREKREAFVQLGGQKLINLAVDSSTGKSTLTFDLDTKLEIRRMERDSKGELWFLYGPDGMALVIRGDGTQERVPGSGTSSLKANAPRKNGIPGT